MTRLLRGVLVISGLASCFGVVLRQVTAAQSSSEIVQLAQLAKTSPVSRALEAIRTTESQTLSDQIRFCETAAPPFEESARAQLLRRSFEEVGLRNVRIDAAGNVLGDRPGVAPRPHLIVASHLDTVFPPGTKVAVSRSGSTLKGPGIGDNCRGLAALVAIVRSLQSGGIQTEGTITFVANVGEEGLGDLRGMKELFRADGARREVDSFVSIDGPGLYVVNAGVGSHRYRVTFKGPGGHSYASFGTASPIGALGRAIAKINDFQVSDVPRTTFNVGRVGGGTSINAIAEEAWMEVDLRSTDPAALASLDARFNSAVDAGVNEENRRWGTQRRITATKDLVGVRPAGSTPLSAPIVRTALAAAEALGTHVQANEASTDANFLMSLGIPAITVGGGGDGADTHALSESFDGTDAWKGAQHALLVVIALARR